MKIKTHVTFKEYVKLLYYLTYHKPVMILLLGVALTMLIWIVLYYFHYFNLSEPLIYQYITLGLIAVVQPIVIYTTIRRNYYSSNHLREHLQMELLQEEMRIEGESFYMEFKWDKMHRIVEKVNYFLVYQNNLSAIIIPKKDLSTEDVNDFRKILQNLKGVPVELRV